MPCYNPNMKAYFLAGITVGALFLAACAGQQAQTSVLTAVQDQKTDPQTEELAVCLLEKGVQLYSAIACEDCQKQHQDFGQALQYVETYTCDGDDASACAKAGIINFPTWSFPQYGLVPGTLNLETIAQLSGC